MKKLLTATAMAEAATGLALIAVPALVVRLLFGADLTALIGHDDLAAVGIVVSRVAGIALIALGISCWPGQKALYGMLAYNALATLYLTCVGFGGEWVGPLLWPAVLLHAAITVWCISCLRRGR